MESEQYNDIVLQLARLHVLRGIEFTRQLQAIASRVDFHQIDGEANIYSIGGENGDDYQALLNAARRAVGHGFRVFILPNPKNIRTADFIFERKGLYRMYDLKTITGRSSIINRLVESIGQTNHVLLNMATNYNARLLAAQIKRYFELNPLASEVLIFKGSQAISVKRAFAQDKHFIFDFSRKYGK